EERGAAPDRLGQDLGSAARPDRHQRERPRQERVPFPVPSHHDELAGLGAGQRLAAGQAKHEIASPQLSIFLNFRVEVAHPATRGPIYRERTSFGFEILPSSCRVTVTVLLAEI